MISCPAGPRGGTWRWGQAAGSVLLVGGGIGGGQVLGDGVVPGEG